MIGTPPPQVEIILTSHHVLRQLRLPPHLQPRASRLIKRTYSVNNYLCLEHKPIIKQLSYILNDFDIMKSIYLSLETATRYFFFIRIINFWLSLGLFLIFPIHLLKILAKSQPRCLIKFVLIKKKACMCVSTDCDANTREIVRHDREIVCIT